MSSFSSVPLVSMICLSAVKKKKKIRDYTRFKKEQQADKNDETFYRMSSNWGSISPLRAERQVSWLARRSPFLWSDGPTVSAMTKGFVRRGPGFPPGTASADRPARSCRTGHRHLTSCCCTDRWQRVHIFFIVKYTLRESIKTNYLHELTLIDSAPGVMSPSRWLNRSSEWPGLPWNMLAEAPATWTHSSKVLCTDTRTELMMKRHREDKCFSCLVIIWHPPSHTTLSCKTSNIYT